MGLDNYITIKFKNHIPLQEMAHYGFTPDRYMGDGDLFELLYWRKCWNVRQIIAEVLGQFTDTNWLYNKDDNIFDATFSLPCFEKMLDALRDRLYNISAWEGSRATGMGSIWDWHCWDDKNSNDDGVGDNFWHHLTRVYQVLEFLRYKCNPDDYELKFVDSW